MAVRDARGRWLPGTGSPNPAGRPRDSILAELNRQLALEDDQGRSKAARLVDKLLELGMAGDTRALAIIARHTLPAFGTEIETATKLIIRDYTGAGRSTALEDRHSRGSEPTTVGEGALQP